MKKFKFSLSKVSLIVAASLSIISCQEMDRPALGDYPSDVGTYTPLDGEKLFAQFDNQFFLNSVTGAPATKVGAPGLGEPKNGESSFKSIADSHISYPITGMFTNELSIAFWYKVNASPDRSGLFVVGSPTAYAISGDESRKYGFRLFREGSGTSQTIKLNAGFGTGESWNDGGTLPVDGNWVYITVTMSSTESKIYFNGIHQRTSTYPSSLNFSGCSDLVIGAGGPTFSYWDHKSDISLYDDVKLFNKVLTEAEIIALMN
jgi:Concanavalin A-like lectin/glucanases superfamily